jgi:hypothetical protein
MRIDYYFSITFAIYNFLGKKIGQKIAPLDTPTKIVNSGINHYTRELGVFILV